MKIRHRRIVALAITLISAIPATAAGMSRESYGALRAVDLRLATIAYRLTTANASLCRDLQPVPGFALHAIDQYAATEQGTVRSVFDFEAPVSVEAVVPGSPAARAGLRDDDAILSIDGTAMPVATAGPATGATRDAALALVAREPADKPLRIVILRHGERREIVVPASAGCRSAFEVLLGPDMDASSDGRIVQIGVRFFERYDDDQVAVIVAHELSHTILRHRIRLEAAGVKWGLLSEMGRNGRLFRRTETDADLLGAHLLRNAGYDPQIAVRFWREHGGDIDGGLFRSRTHPSSRARADAVAAEIAAIPPGAPRPYAPPLLATRDRPLE